MTDIAKVNSIGTGAGLQVRNIETITGEIKALQKSAVCVFIEIGRRLCEAKELLHHGEFGAWLEREVEFSESTANNYMKLFRELGSAQSSLWGAELNSQAFEKLSYTKALKMLELPREERENFISEHDVEHLSTRELDRLIKERDEARKAKECAEQRLAETEEKNTQAITNAHERADRLAEELTEKKESVRQLNEQIELLRNRPIDVAVAQADPKETEEAVKKATAEIEKARKKELAELEKKLKAAEKEKAAAEIEKEKADEERKRLAEQLAEEKKKTEAAENRAESLKKVQAMSDPVVTEFKTLFNEVQRMLGRLRDLAASAGENKEKLEAALAAMIESYKVGTEKG